MQSSYLYIVCSQTADLVVNFSNPSVTGKYHRPSKTFQSYNVRLQFYICRLFLYRQYYLFDHFHFSFTVKGKNAPKTHRHSSQFKNKKSCLCLYFIHFPAIKTINRLPREPGSIQLRKNRPDFAYILILLRFIKAPF